MSLETRSGATSTQEQGDKIEDAMLWAFKCTLESNGTPVVTDQNITATGWRYVPNVSNTYKELANIHIPLDVCVEDGETTVTQSYVLFAVINTKAFDPNFNLGSTTTYAQLTKAVFEGGEFWGKYPQTTYNENGELVSATPEVMPVSNWATFTVQTNNTDKNTHPNNCYSLTLPVYRAVAKTQLYMRKSSADFALKVLDAKVVSTKAPTKGAMFTKMDFGTSKHTTKAADHPNATNYRVQAFGYPNQTDGLEWWQEPTFGSAQKAWTLMNTSTTGETTTSSFSEQTISTYAEDTYEWVGSTFLFENDQTIAVNDNYSDVTTDGGGYYLEVKYQIDSEKDPKLGYVPLPYVVRNHDYQIHATVEAGGKMVLTLKVEQWKPVTEVHNYLNEVSIPQGGHIKWSGVQPDANGVITLGAAANISATCSFFLNTPANGTWQAELVTVEGQEGAFTFVDANGNSIGSTTSGPIAGSATPASLTIKTTRDNSIQGGAVSENKVELRITATATVGGVQRTYKVTGLTGITGVDYYTIVQTR